MAILDIQNPEITLTKKQKHILDFIEANPERAAYVSLKDLSRQMQVSEVAILNFCKKVGAENFVGLKQILQNYIKLQITKENKINESIKELNEEGGSAAIEALQRDVKNINILTQQLDMETIDRVTASILEARNLYVIASGITSYLADYLANRLRNMGLNALAFNVTETESVQSALMTISSSDYSILMSFPPYSKRMKNVLTLLEERNVAFATISDSEECPAVRKDGNTLMCCVESNHVWNSHTALVALINILSANVGEKMGNRMNDLMQEKEEIMEKLIQ